MPGTDVKMVHNGIEYGLMQAYAEGFEIMHASDYELDLAAISEMWMHGSVVRSWLLELAVRAFKSQGQDLDHLKGWVADSGEGRWTVQEAIDKDVPAPVITLSLLTRFRSRQDDFDGAQGASPRCATSSAATRSRPTRPGAATGRRPMDLATAVERLEAAGTEQNRRIYRRHGARDPLYGVSFAVLDTLAKEAKRDQALARRAVGDRELTTAGSSRARSPTRTCLTEATLDAWLAEIDVVRPRGRVRGVAGVAGARRP